MQAEHTRNVRFVPRWGGDTNSMAVPCDTGVVPDALDTLAAQLVENARNAGLGG
jgi:hypothetical protein